jgi:methenyltetrahydrofolate cyclohydrolase
MGQPAGVSDANQGAAGQLIDLAVREFVDAVASADTPVPAGGSVAALSGAMSAALLVLVCEVLQRRRAGEFSDELRRLAEFEQQLLDLVDEDARAYASFLDARRTGVGRDEAVERVTRTPLAIGRASVHIVELSHRVEEHEVRAMRGDVRAARHLAQAALRTAVDLAEANIELQSDRDARRALVEEIGRLRQRLT